MLGELQLGFEQENCEEEIFFLPTIRPSLDKTHLRLLCSGSETPKKMRDERDMYMYTYTGS
jgi:hypothetical protein